MQQPKINKLHYSRKAYVYIRQSTMEQVRKHHESQRIQYKLVELAKELGWQEAVTIDEDLGRSGSGTVERPGFSRLLLDVAENKVGAIFCVEASRLARNNREWYLLLDYCKLTDTIIIDLDGFYDPNNLTDRVSLGLKGTMSEYESGIFRQRARAAILEKANRGEFYTNIPAAYIVTDDDRCQMNPDQRILDVTHLIFQKFRELGTANQVVLWFRQENIEAPCRSKRAVIIWKLPTNSLIKRLLRNPIFTGAYTYGRTKVQTKIVDGKPRKYTKELPIEEWEVLIKNHHPAYISWDEYLANIKRLPQNSSKRGAEKKGAPKKGPGLLTSLLRCRRCSQKLSVRYSSSNPGVPRYSCVGEHNIGKCGNCISFYGTSLERLVSEEVLRVVQPGAVKAAERAEELYYQQQKQKQQSILNALKQAEYEANRGFEQFNLADAKNRLVAFNLETRWEQSLKTVEKIKQQLDEIQKKHKVLTQQQRKKFRKLANDLHQLWHNRDTDIRIKKRILQTLIKEIMVDIEDDNSINAVIHWIGGTHTQYQIKRRKKVKLPNDGYPDTKESIKQLAQIIPDQDIARILNLLKIKTPSEESWNALRVLEFRQQHHIPAFDPLEYEKKGWVNLKQAAEILGTFPETISRLIKEKIIKARQIIKYSPWMIEKEQLKKPEVLQAINKLKNGVKTISKNQTDLNL